MAADPVETHDFADVWVVLPTYNEIENLPQIVPAILGKLPGATLLVVDDSSPDGTGELADNMAAEDGRLRVLHRPSKQGLGKAYVAGFHRALAAGAGRIVQMDADWSHDPEYLPSMLARIGPPAGAGGEVAGAGTTVAGKARTADLVIGSRYVKGGAVRNWGVTRKVISRGGSLFARTVLRLSLNDLTGGFKAWRASTLAAVPLDRLHSGGYVFQIEATFVASRQGAHIVEVPIVFVDRRLGASKMSRRIIVEALIVVLQLRWDELRGRPPKRR